MQKTSLKVPKIKLWGAIILIWDKLMVIHLNIMLEEVKMYLQVNLFHWRSFDCCRERLLISEVLYGSRFTDTNVYFIFRNKLFFSFFSSLCYCVEERRVGVYAKKELVPATILLQWAQENNSGSIYACFLYDVTVVPFHNYFKHYIADFLCSGYEQTTDNLLTN